MIYKAVINDLPVKAYYSDESIEKIFIPLLKKLTKMQQEKGGRVLAILAAPPGSGKSTLLNFLKYLSEHTEGVTPITTIGMDGFHRYQKDLNVLTMMRDGEEHLMKEFKGAPETFDLEGLSARLKKVAAGEVCGWPEYYRIAHDPVDDVISVEGDIVLMEGNYLLLNWDGWRKISELADYTMKIIADESLLKKRLVERKAKSGISMEEAEKFVVRSDFYNVQTVLRDSMDADLVLKLMEDDSYEEI